MKIKDRVFPYYQAMVEIFTYQVVSKIALWLWSTLLHHMAMWILQSTGRVAISSGDFKFILTTWQGSLLILVALCTMFAYVVFDLNTKIIFASKLLNREEISIRQVMKEALFSIPKLLSFSGIGVVLYVTLLAPILGIGVSVSLTEELYIPTFISSVIESTPLYNMLYLVFCLVFSIVGIANIFILHGVVLDRLTVKEAGEQSKRLMKANWKNYFKEILVYTLLYMLIIGGLVILLIGIMTVLVGFLNVSVSKGRFLTLFVCILIAICASFFGLMIIPFYVMKVTQLYYSYKGQKKEAYLARDRKKHPWVVALSVLVVVFSAAFAAIANMIFDDVFPETIPVRIIAHRGGGNEGAENTVAGLLTAYELGANGSEIDIQRTKDGYYIVNHDTDFLRTTGVNKKPGEMTLEQIKQLSVDGEPIATLEEMLDASRDKVTLFIELKGDSADKRMAEDAIALIKEYGMQEQAVLISLKYDLIDYIETTYPEMLTGYLTFVSFGDTAKLNCDYLGLEEESATSSAISAIHQQGKKALVWTANEKGNQRHFLLSDADYLITDNVKQAMEVIQELESRDDFTKILDGVLSQ